MPLSYWSALNCSNNPYNSYSFLKAFESSNTNISFYYLFVTKDEKPIALAITQTIIISIESITKNISMPTWLRNTLNKLFSHSHLKVLFCGNAFLSGEYGIFISSESDKKEAFKTLAEALKSLIKKTKKLNAIFVKDFKTNSLTVTDVLLQYDFTNLQVEPNMIVDIDEKWQSFDDYKSQLKSKYRVKVNKADSNSKELTSKIFNIEDIIGYKDQLQTLYENTISNSDFNAQILDLSTYIALKKDFNEVFIVKGYFLNNQLVGFLSAMLSSNNLDAHFIGLDYSKNKVYAIYQRILNDYIRLGIEKKVNYVNLGRTALEIKSTIGAKPETLVCYAKHKNPLMNRVLKRFIKNIKIKPYKQHQPFKA